MGFNGSGVFNRIHSWISDRNNGIKITADRHDAEDDGFATGLSNTICKDGQSTTSARIPFSQGLSVGDGTVSDPAINFMSDTNNGLYRISADKWGGSAGSSLVFSVTANEFVIAPSKNVGINTGSHTVDAPLHIGDVNYSIVGTTAQVLVARNIDAAAVPPATGWHEFEVGSVITHDNALLGHASYNTYVTVDGDGDLNHVAGFQYFANIETTGTVDTSFGFMSFPTIDDGTVINNIGMMIFDPGGTGTVNYNYGIIVRELTRGSIANIGIRVAGEAVRSIFDGQLEVGNFDNVLSGKLVVYSDNAAALQISKLATNVPLFIVDTSAASAATGWQIIAKAAGAGGVLTVISTNGDENGEISSKGTGTLSLQPSATGDIIFNRDVVPAGAGATALGKSGTPFSNVFLTNGGTIDFNASEVKIRHGTNTIVFDAVKLFALGPNSTGTVNPTLYVDGTAVSAETGLTILGQATGNGVRLSATSPGANELLTIDAKAAGVIRLASASTGAVEFGQEIVPTANDGAALGTATRNWSDLFLYSAAVINFNNGNYTITHASGLLTFSGAVTISGNTSIAGNLKLGGAGPELVSIDKTTSGTGFFRWDSSSVFKGAIGLSLGTNDGAIGASSGDMFYRSAGNLLLQGGNVTGLKLTGTNVQANLPFVPATSDGAALGTSSLMFSDLFLASGAVINFNNGNSTLTHAAGSLTIGGATLVTKASATGGSGLRIPAGAAPTSPVAGDLWMEGTSLKFYDGSTTKTITMA